MDKRHCSSVNYFGKSPSAFIHRPVFKTLHTVAELYLEKPEQQQMLSVDVKNFHMSPGQSVSSELLPSSKGTQLWKRCACII